MIDERSNEKQILLEKDQSYGRRITLGEHTRSVGVEETVFDREEKAVIVG